MNRSITLPCNFGCLCIEISFEARGHATTRNSCEISTAVGWDKVHTHHRHTHSPVGWPGQIHPSDVHGGSEIYKLALTGLSHNRQQAPKELLVWTWRFHKDFLIKIAQWNLSIISNWAETTTLDHCLYLHIWMSRGMQSSVGLFINVEISTFRVC